MLILVTIICIALFLVLWRQRINRRKVRKELALSERFNQLEHQAVSAMMNPHFLSNSLNSVQYLMNSERNEEANNYIVMMASLMRKNLDTAGSGFILLSEEVIRLKLYLDLEKLRLQEGFFYTIHTEKGIDTTSVMIPNMIIQPFVENSIWHGIIPSGKQGLVTVSFHFDDVKMDSFSFRSMIIKITDNGIGINKAGKDKKEDHISKGIKIVEERLRLLCMKMQLPKPVLIEDLSSRQPGLHGTEVILSLPPPLYKQSVPSANSISSPAGHFCSGTGH